MLTLFGGDYKSFFRVSGGLGDNSLQAFFQRGTVLGESGGDHKLPTSKMIWVFDLPYKLINAFLLGQILIYAHIADINQILWIQAVIHKKIPPQLFEVGERLAIRHKLPNGLNTGSDTAGR
jgi:hypothetical protein